MKMVRIVVCDDSEQDREKYTRLCRMVSDKYNIPIEIKQYVNGNDLLFDLEEPKYYSSIDIILLNINMPGPNGIEVAEQARKIGYNKLIIFITSSKDHYEPAFDVKGYNYITKGKEHESERFEKVLQHALEDALKENNPTLVISAGGSYKQIKVDSIKYFEVNKNLITVYYGDKSLEFISTLNKLENQLESQGFYRTQKSYLIALDYVKSFTYQEVTLQNDVKIPVGRKYYRGLKEKMERMSDRLAQ